MSNTAQAPIHSSKKTSQKSSATTVNVMTVIDTDYIKDNYGPNTSKDAPTGIKHVSQKMSCSYKNLIDNSDPGSIVFSANVGDTVSFWATTLSNNSDDAVLLYDVQLSGGKNVFNPTFEINEEIISGAVIPDINSSTHDGQPAIPQQLNFYSYDAKVKNQGTEDFQIYFALYTLDEIRENQTLYGYFVWDPRIEVK